MQNVPIEEVINIRFKTKIKATALPLAVAQFIEGKNLMLSTHDISRNHSQAHKQTHK